MPLPFEEVREQLLRVGIVPGHASRYVTELREHLADLVAQERASGLSPQQAEARAIALLGSDTQLVQAMIDRAPPRSLAARAPWSAFAVLPVALLLLVTCATAVSMMYLLLPVRGMAPSDMPGAYSGLIAVVSFISRYLVGPLLAGGCIAIALRQRMTSRWLWVGLGLIALASGLLGFQMHFIPPEGGTPGRTLFSAVGVVYLEGRPDLLATLGAAALRSTVLFVAASISYRALRRHLSSMLT